MTLEMIETTELVVGLPHQQALFKKYQSQPVLDSNRVYRMVLKFKNQPTLESTFTTALDPCLATIKDIRRDLGRFADEIDDEVLLRIIYENSQSVDELLGEDVDITAEVQTKAEKKWTRYQTDVDIIEIVYLGLAKDFGTFKKVIGDITVSNTQNLPGLDTLLSRFKKKVQEAEDVLSGSSGTIVSSFVKASSSYTYDERETF